MVLKQMLSLWFDRSKGNNLHRQYDTYLVGYYGMQNSGDDALLLSSIMGAKHYLQSRSLIVSASTDIDFEGHDFDVNPIRETQTFKGQNRLQHYYAAMRSERVVFGGGSVLHTAQDIQIKRHMMALSNPEKCMALGVGIGPFNDANARKQCKRFLNECGFVGVRDKKSYELAKQLAPEANIKLTFDLAPMLALSSITAPNNQSESGILINVCPVPKDAMGRTDHHQHKVMLTKMSNVIEDTWNASHEPINLISLNGHQQYGDNLLCKQLVDKFEGKIPVKFIPYQANPLEMMNIISGHKVFLSMRLHGLVFGYLTGTPVLAVNYHTKGHQWCEQVGMATEQRFDAVTFKPKELVKTLLMGLKTGFKAPALAVNDAVNQSLSNWRYQHD